MQHPPGIGRSWNRLHKVYMLRIPVGRGLVVPVCARSGCPGPGNGGVFLIRKNETTVRLVFAFRAIRTTVGLFRAMFLVYAWSVPRHRYSMRKLGMRSGMWPGGAVGRCSGLIRRELWES